MIKLNARDWKYSDVSSASYRGQYGAEALGAVAMLICDRNLSYR